MNAYQLKWIAIVTMIIDHLGLFFFPQFLWLRMIGRLAFPLFAWLIANGAYHTHNIEKYLLRLFLFAMVAQIPFLAANRLVDPPFTGLNVLCTLFFGLVSIYFIQRTNDKKIWIGVTIVCAILAQVLQTDYGGFGVASVVLFYLFFNNFWQLVKVQTILLFAYLFFVKPDIGFVELIGLLSLIFIKFYNGKPGRKAKYLFYIFYPVQFVVYYVLLKINM